MKIAVHKVTGVKSYWGLAVTHQVGIEKAVPWGAFFHLTR